MVLSDPIVKRRLPQSSSNGKVPRSIPENKTLKAMTPKVHTGTSHVQEIRISGPHKKDDKRKIEANTKRATAGVRQRKLTRPKLQN